MRKILNCLKLIVLFCFLPSSLYADEYITDIDDANVHANINVDNFSSVEINPGTAEIGIEAEVIVLLTDYLGNPISGHSVRLYIDGDDTGVVLTQPEDSNSSGMCRGKIKVSNPGTYKIMAVDNTYGYDISITDFDIFYAVPLNIPFLLSEPYYTQSIENTIKWVSEEGYSYLVEASRLSDFSLIDKESGWLSGSKYTFTNLSDGIMYYYRLKKKNIGDGESGWSNTVYGVQDYSAPVITLISVENLDKTSKTSDDFIKIISIIEDNISVKSEITSCVLSNGSLYKCASITSLSGNIYTAEIPFDELERNKQGDFLNEYSFCIEALDEAGNISRNCNINIILKEATAANISESLDTVFSFEQFVIRPFTYLPYIFVNNVTGIMTDSQISITSLLVSSVVFFVLLSLYFGNISIPFLYPIYWMFLPIKKTKKYLLYGVVYDSFTKEPLKYSVIRIFNKKEKRIGICMTDDHGNFIISLNENNVIVSASRSNFVFPSVQITEKTDYPYLNVYTGGHVNFRNFTEVYISIPLDVKKENSVFLGIKSALNILTYIFLLLIFSFSVYMSFYIFSSNMNVFNFVILLFNILDTVLILKFLFEKVKRRFTVKDKSGRAIAGVTIVVKDAGSGKIKDKRVTGRKGLYTFDLDEGEYVLDILNTNFNLVAAENGREFKIPSTGREYFGKDLIVEKK